MFVFRGASPTNVASQPGEEPRGVGDVVDVRLVDVDHPFAETVGVFVERQRSLHEEEKCFVFLIKNTNKYM